MGKEEPPRRAAGAGPEREESFPFRVEGGKQAEGDTAGNSPDIPFEPAYIALWVR